MAEKVETEASMKVTGDDQASPMLDRLTAKVKEFNSMGEKQARLMRNTGVAMTVMGAGGIMAANNLVQGAARTEDAMANVNTMLGKGESAFKSYDEKVNELITSIPIQGGKVEALNALYGILSAGVESGAKATKVLEVAMKAARGGLTSTEVAVDGITTAMNAFGESAGSADDIASVMFQGVKMGKMTFEELVAAMGPVAGMAAQVGVSMQETVSTLATLTKGGIQARRASTSLRGVIASFIKPSEQMAKAVEKMGYQSGSAMLKQLGLQGAMNKLSESVGGQEKALAELFPNQEALIAVLPLVGKMAATAAEDMDTMANSAGAAGEAYAKTAETTSAKLQILAARLEIAKEKMSEGATPAMLKLREAQVRATEGMAWLNEKTGGAIGAMAVLASGVMATVGPIMAIIGQLALYRIARQQAAAATVQDTAATTVNSTGKIAAALATAKATVAQWAHNAAMYASPIMWIVALIVALIAVIYLLVKNWDKVTKAMGRFAAWVKGGLKTAFNLMKKLIMLPIVAIKALVRVFGWMFGKLKAGLKAAAGKLREWGGKVKSALSKAGGWIKSKLGGMVKNFKKSSAKKLALAKKLGAQLPALYKKMASKMYNAIADKLGKLKGFFGKLGDKMKKWGKGLISKFSDGIKSASHKLQKGLKSVGGKIKGWLGFSRPPMFGDLHNVPRWGKGLMKSYGGGVLSGIPDLNREVRQATAQIKIDMPAASAAAAPTMSSDNRRFNFDIHFHGGGGATEDNIRQLTRALRRQVGVI